MKVSPSRCGNLEPFVCLTLVTNDWSCTETEETTGATRRLQAMPPCWGLAGFGPGKLRQPLAVRMQ